jgi:hypothetical protein
MEIINKTMGDNSSFDQEEITIFAGRVLLIFYCLIFIFGLLGILKKEFNLI